MLSFHVKFVHTDKRTDGRTTVKQYAPDLSIRGNKKKTLVKTEVKSKSIVPNNVDKKIQVLKFHNSSPS